MPLAVNLIVNQALKLSSFERSDVIEKLVASLNAPNASIDAIWAEEADARIEAYEKAKIKAISVHEVFQKYQKL